MSENILKAIAVTAELTGTELSRHALLAMQADLVIYPEAAALRALDRCRKELKGRLTVAAVIERIQSADGRPTANEAWALALRYFDESQTVVVNDEIREACSIARAVIEADDEVGARMAFRDAYERIITSAREQGRMPTWTPSLGYDKDQQRAALTDAVERGLLNKQQVAGFLPAPLGDVGVAIAGLLTNKQEPVCVDYKEKIAQIKAMLKGGKP